MSYVYKNLTQPKNTASGVSDYLLLAPVSDFEVDGIKCPEAPFANQGDEVKIYQPHVFKADRGFAKFALAPQKNQLSAKTIGDLGFQQLDFEAKFFMAGSYAEVHEAIKNLINTPLIALLKDSNCADNILYQLGCDCVYAYLKADFATGTTKDGNKGYDCTISYQNGYVQLYADPAGPKVLGD